MVLGLELSNRDMGRAGKGRLHCVRLTNIFIEGKIGAQRDEASCS